MSVYGNVVLQVDDPSASVAEVFTRAIRSIILDIMATSRDLNVDGEELDARTIEVFTGQWPDWVIGWKAESRQLEPR